MNIDMEVEVSREEIKTIKSSFQKPKIPRPHGWSTYTFIGFFDLVIDASSTKNGKALQLANPLSSIGVKADPMNSFLNRNLKLGTGNKS